MTQPSYDASSRVEDTSVSENDLHASGPGGPEGPGGPTGGGSGGSGGSGGPADPEETQDPVRAFLSMIREIVLVLVIALGLSLIIKTFLMQAFFIPSPSMNNTLIEGDRVLVSKLTPGPFELKRGDVVVFSDPDNWLGSEGSTPVSQGAVRDGIQSALTFVGLLPASSDEHLIKRVIGLPGDKVSCCDSAGRLMVNGKAINEPYVYPNDNPSDKDFSVTVPAGHLWVMGDHRSVSADSRAHTKEADHGFVPVADVVGKAFVLVWPLDRAKLLHNPSTTFAGVPAAGK